MTDAQVTYEQTPEGNILINATANLKALLDTIVYTVRFLVTETGTMDISVTFDLTQIQGVFPALPRVGVQMLLPAGFDEYSWYGKGPHENYSDRQHSAMVGVYHSSVQAQHFNYIRPQETGNRCGVRWSSVKNTLGNSWRAEATSAPLSASVSPYTQDNLTEALVSLPFFSSLSWWDAF